MFDKFCDVMIGLISVFAIGLTIFILAYLGYNVYGNLAAPYIIRADRNDYYVEEYREEDGYYYATTICDNECKIPVGIAVVKENK